MAVQNIWDIWLASVPLRGCVDKRPCLVIEVLPDGRLLTVPLSAQMDLFDRHRHFLISSTHADFKKTGLGRSSYLVGDEFRELRTRNLTCHLGEISDTLLVEVQEWLG